MGETTERETRASVSLQPDNNDNGNDDNELRDRDAERRSVCIWLIACSEGCVRTRSKGWQGFTTGLANGIDVDCVAVASLRMAWGSDEHHRRI
jgi:hypothetical protein